MYQFFFTTLFSIRRCVWNELRTTSQFVSVHHGRLVHSLARCRREIHWYEPSRDINDCLSVLRSATAHFATR
jgi:hypothetical protein